MPYNPGVVDRSGEIMGAGILGAFQNFSRGMEAFKQRQDENKQLDAENKALELLTKTTAGKVGLPPEMIDQLTIADPHESPKDRNVRLKTSLQGVLTQQQLEDEKQKQALVKAQINQMNMQQAREQQNAMAARAAVAPIVALPAAADVAAAFNRGAPIPTSSTRRPDESEAVLRYLDAQGSDPAFMRSLVDREQTRMQTDQRTISAELRAKIAEEKLANGGGPMVFPSEADLEKRYPAAQFDYSKKVDPATGRVTVPSVSPRAPAKGEPNKFNEALDEALGKQVATVIDRVPEYASTLEQVQRGRAALAAGAKTGGGAETALGLAKLINGVTGTKVFDTASGEVAKSSFQDMALTAASRMRGQGQITEQERKLLQDTVAQLGNSPEALDYIMNYMEAVAQRGLNKAQAVQELRDSGERDSSKYSSILTRFEKENPIDIAKTKAAPAPKSASFQAMSTADLQRRAAELRAKLGR